MSKKKYHLAVLIGRFQPFHNGHLRAFQRASELADRVMILVGSSGGPRTPKNPWTFTERRDMISLALGESTHYIVRPLPDFSYDDSLWVSEVQHLVADFTHEKSKICIAGHAKDESSYYLKIFPQWPFEETGFTELNGEVMTDIDATQIRSFIFEHRPQYIRSVLDSKVYDYINHWKKVYQKDTFENLVVEYNQLEEYKRSWAVAPYTPIFVTVDAVVVQSGHVLVVERKFAPGKGLWALPGGFLNEHERIVPGCIRELLEETNIKLQPDTLSRCIAHREVFDAPYRSLRGRTITNAILFKLNDRNPLPRVAGGDDARTARWMPFSEFERSRDLFFEDHYDIITHMVRKI